MTKAGKKLLRELLRDKLRRLESLAHSYSFTHCVTTVADLEECVRDIKNIESAIKKG